MPLSGVNGLLDFHGGQVIHSSAPYLVFWDPSSLISASSRNLLARYLTDVAHDDGLATNVWSVNRQFTDSTGFADYAQTFSGAQVILDPQAYPARNTSVCNRINATFYPNCLTDGQLQTELTRLIAADSLPTGTGANAPVYLIVTPHDTNECLQASTCADNRFCAYHSSFLTGGHTALYAEIPLFYNNASPAQNPKNCQFDGNSAVQAPNGDPLADVATKYLSHELSETLTDPVNGGGWWDDSSGNEDGDNCNFFGSTVDPQNSSNPNAFGPVLGGSAAAGTLYDQIINANHYYTQTEWSNGELNCEAKPVSRTLSASFTLPAGLAQVNTSLSFNPSASTIAAGDSYTSTTFNWGDGSHTFTTSAPVTKPHTYAAGGIYTVTLTLVDMSGNLSSVSHQLRVAAPPVAAFTAPASANPGTSVSFDASASTQTDGATIVSYHWDFGDGATASGASPTQTHSYATGGTYTVKLTTTDSDGLTGTISHQVAVHTSPRAAFGVSPGTLIAGHSALFSSQTVAGDGTLSSFRWDFGDGGSGSGATATHTYAHGGPFIVTLTVTDSNGLSSAKSEAITVDNPPTASFKILGGSVIAGVANVYDGSKSSDSDGTLTRFAWSFGDGATATGPKAHHTYTRSGRFAVSLTVTDNDGATDTTTGSIDVVAGVTRVKLSGHGLKITVSGPGTLTLGNHTVKVKRAGSASIPFTLSAAQRRKLHKRHTLSLTLKISFRPVSGARTTRTVHVTLHG